MKRAAGLHSTIRKLFATLLAATALTAAACKKDVGSATKESSVDQADAIAEVSVDELDRQLAASAAQAVDANGNITRQRVGTIPGAVLLSDYEAFAISELPADKAKPLVFYCANEHCGASHEAAKRARFAGYQDVKVLPAGIAGWAKAGKAVVKQPSAQPAGAPSAPPTAEPSKS